MMKQMPYIFVFILYFVFAVAPAGAAMDEPSNQPGTQASIACAESYPTQFTIDYQFTLTKPQVAKREIRRDDAIGKVERAAPQIDEFYELLAEKVGSGSGALKAWKSLEIDARGDQIGTVFILVQIELYAHAAVPPLLTTYASDLSSEGYKALVYAIQFEGSIDPLHSRVKNLKAFIRRHWLELAAANRQGVLSDDAFDLGTGVVLIGDFPRPVICQRGAINAETGLPYEGIYPSDLYLTDMDGAWQHVAKNGVPLVSTADPGIIDSECSPDDAVRELPVLEGSGTCGAKPEIWLGQINPARSVDQINEVVVELRDYFHRNHAYRTGAFPFVPQGADPADYAAKNRLAYADDDFSRDGRFLSAAHNRAWPGPVIPSNDLAANGAYPEGESLNRYIDAPLLTASNDYLTRLGSYRHLWVEALTHSASRHHSFREPEGYIYAANQPGTVPLELYYNDARGDNFVTATAEGRQSALDAGYRFVRTEGYIFPLGTIAPSLTPLKLYWNADRKDNFTTASTGGIAIASDPMSKYTFVRNEGIVFKEPMPDTVPLEHYYNNDRGDNFIAATPAGKGDAAAANYDLTTLGQVKSEDLSNTDLRSLFYYIQGCSSCNYLMHKNLCDTYLFPGASLAVIGNTTVGPHDNGEFYRSLGSGFSIGQALMLQQRAATSRTKQWTFEVTSNWRLDPKRHYSMVLRGDPTLRPAPVTPLPSGQQIKSLPWRSYSDATMQIPRAFRTDLAKAVQQAEAQIDKTPAIVEQIEPRGYNFLEIRIGNRIIDPYWRYSSNPELKRLAEAYEKKDEKNKRSDQSK
jgi:hypothetical protein